MSMIIVFQTNLCMMEWKLTSIIFKDNDGVYSYDLIQDGFVTAYEYIDIGKKLIPYKSVFSNFIFKQMDLIIFLL